MNSITVFLHGLSCVLRLSALDSPGTLCISSLALLESEDHIRMRQQPLCSAMFFQGVLMDPLLHISYPPPRSCSHELLRYYPLLSSPCLFLVLWLSHPAGVWVVMRAFGFRFPTPFLVCVCCLLWFLSSTSDLGFQKQGDFSLLDSLNVPGVWNKSGHFPGRFCCMLTPCVFVQTWLLNGKKSSHLDLFLLSVVIFHISLLVIFFYLEFLLPKVLVL